MSLPTHFDFGDGRGPVPAARHRNPDGSLGGWVAKTANVDPQAHIGAEARVSGSAVVLQNAIVWGQAWVFGEALILPGAKVGERAWVCDQAWVSGVVRGDVLVSGAAWVRSGIYQGRLWLVDVHPRPEDLRSLPFV